jgi:hypothetical protein
VSVRPRVPRALGVLGVALLALPVASWAVAPPDVDGDGLDAAEEALRGTSDTDADSDDDGLSDGDEVNGTATDPTTPDTDGDGLYDGTEVGNTTTTAEDRKSVV